MTIEELANKKAMKAEKYNVFIDEELKTEQAGIYGYFYRDPRGNEHCIYVGKATSFYDRTFSKNGHIHKFLRFMETNREMYSDEFLNDSMATLIENNCSIIVRCLEIVYYFDAFFTRAAQRLAVAELYWITKYQNIEECLDQMPEGVGPNEEEYWRNHYAL